MTINEIRAKWKEIEPKIIEHIKNGECSDSYTDIVRILARLMLEKERIKLYTLEFGGCQGVLVFIFAPSGSTDDLRDIYIVSNYYGSCSGCDQLESIVDESGPITDDNTLNDLLSLCRDIYDRIRPLSPLENPVPLPLVEQKENE